MAGGRLELRECGKLEGGRLKRGQEIVEGRLERGVESLGGKLERGEEMAEEVGEWRRNGGRDRRMG